MPWLKIEDVWEPGITMGKVKTSTFVAKTDLYPRGQATERVRMARESVEAGMNRVVERAWEYRRNQDELINSISDDLMRKSARED